MLGFLILSSLSFKLRSCKQVQPFFNRMLGLVIAETALAILMIVSIIVAVALSVFKFEGVTVDGFAPDTGKAFPSIAMA